LRVKVREGIWWIGSGSGVATYGTACGACSQSVSTADTIADLADQGPHALAVGLVVGVGLCEAEVAPLREACGGRDAEGIGGHECSCDT